MKAPRRLSHDSEDALARRLLSAGRARAPRGAKDRALAAATAGITTTGLASGSAAGTGWLARLASMSAPKWLALAGLAGAMGGGALLGRSHGEPVAPAPTATAPPTAVAPLPSAVTAPPSAIPNEPQAAVAPIAELVDAGAAPTASSVPVVVAARRVPEVPSASTMREELAWLERARTALATGDATRALALLDAYRAHFPHAEMVPEATVLRIEALVAAGDHAAAERTADGFLARNPKSPYASRIRSLVGNANP